MLPPTDFWGMMATHEQTISDSTERGMVTLTTSPDVAATIGRPGLLEDRVGAAAIDRIGPLRSDALLTHLRRHTGRGGVLITSLHSDLFDADHLPAEETITNLTEVAGILGAQDTALFVFNVSTYDPADQTHAYADQGDTYAIRAHRLLVGLEKSAGDAGINVVDVDGAVAEVGGNKSVPAPGVLTGEALDFITEEAILAIDQSGALGGTLQAPVMRLVVPSFDRRTKVGTVTRWHVTAGTAVQDGDALFEVRFESRVHRYDMGKDEETRSRVQTKGRSEKAGRFDVMDITVVAGSEAYVHNIVLSDGSPVTAGDVAAIMTTTPDGDATAADAAADFRVGAKMLEH
jgi:hypothetical protein